MDAPIRRLEQGRTPPPGRDHTTEIMPCRRPIGPRHLFGGWSAVIRKRAAASSVRERCTAPATPEATRWRTPSHGTVGR